MVTRRALSGFRRPSGESRLGLRRAGRRDPL